MIVVDVGDGERDADRVRCRCGPREVLYRHSLHQSDDHLA